MSKRGKGILAVIALAAVLLLGCRFIYMDHFSPMYVLESNDKTEIYQGREYAIHKLSRGGEVFYSLPLPLNEPDHYNFGRQIGRTPDGMRIYKVKGEPQKLMMNGFMFPPVIFERKEKDFKKSK